MTQEAVVNLLERLGALVTNTHVVLASWRHGGAYINKDILFQHPKATSRICNEIAKLFTEQGVQAVIGPVVGGAIMQQWVAHHLSRINGYEVLGGYAEKIEGGFILKRGYERMVEGKQILLVEDILTTGGSTRLVADAVKTAGGIIVGVGALWNRGGVTKEAIGNVPMLKSLVNTAIKDWDHQDCPLCMERVPINTQLGRGKEYLNKVSPNI